MISQKPFGNHETRRQILKAFILFY